MKLNRGNLAGKYIFSEMLPGFTIGVGVFVFILLLFQALRLTEFLLTHNPDWSIIGRMTLYLTISFLPAILPMALLFSVLLTYGRLSNDSEIVAMKALGLSLWHLLTPAAFLGALVAGISVKTTFSMAPWGNRQFELLINELGSAQVVETIRSGTFSDSFFDLVVYANEVNQTAGLLSKVFIYDGRDAANPVTIIAKSGILREAEAEPGDKQPKATLLQLSNGTIHRPSGSTYTKVDFDNYSISLKTQARSSDAEKSPPSLSIEELETLLKGELKDDRRWTLLAEFHKRLAIPMACFIFSLLGVGLGTVTNRRSARSGGLVLSLAVIVIYWGLYVTAESMAKQGTAPAWILLWAPNLLFGSAAILSLRRAYD